MSDNFEQRSDSLDQAFKKPKTSKSAEDLSKDLIANFERSFDDLSKPETRESAESKENQEAQERNPDQPDQPNDKLPSSSDRITTRPPDKKDRPNGLTSGDAMGNIVDELGLGTDKTSRLVTDILSGNMASSDRKALAKRGPEGAAAVQIASKIEAKLGQINGNTSVILENAQKLAAGQASDNPSPIVQDYANQVAEQLQKGLPPKEAMAYVLVNQMAVALVEGLKDSGVKLG